MSWARFDDRTPSHPKIASLSDAAFRLWFASVCYCAEHLTDGFVPAKIPSAFPRAPSGKKLKATIAELLDERCWEEAEGGWMVHGYLDWNPSGEAVRAKREARAAAGRVGGQKSGRSRGKPEASDEAIASDQESQNPKQLLKQTRSNCLSKPEAKTNPVPVFDPKASEVVAEELPDQRAHEPFRPPPQPRSRFQELARAAGSPPRPRKDLTFSRFSFAEWFPSQQWLDWWRETGLSEANIDATLVEARDKLLGSHDIEWWDTKILRYFDVTIDRARKKTTVQSPEPEAVLSP